ncbi:hypothetical protein MUN78_16040 [Leucobacter allii]|uniref:DUF7882 domain-containing protein n=1 Tax=Leucobacter allii TaxID=2932247 RepID=A0ABY4FLI1_9MICO|nr:hypothetical protein [Leucobacter allii]UOQ57142.1 hypothetical protein MUN78_16040 [Leucobacter allii]UOR01648.1 hypothetical protein MUN77_16280 [Leucobacter allii]
MGCLHYGPRLSYAFDDRTLAHLRAVITAKLLRQESFVLTWNEGAAQRTVWLHPSVDLVFDFDEYRAEPLNLAWLEVLSDLANSPAGLRLVEEPEAAE